VSAPGNRVRRGRPGGARDQRGRARRVEDRVVGSVVRRAMARLRSLRVERDVSVLELAAAAGVDDSHIRHLERGCCNTTIDTLVRLACALGVPPYTVLE
jgi:ribosome-binding protein aMBF1 (putative translation factor)